MELVLVGFVFGVAASVLAFILWNLQNKSSLDKVEEEIREKTPEYEAAKERVKKRIRKAAE
jgi:hypothetical protein